MTNMKTTTKLLSELQVGDRIRLPANKAEGWPAETVVYCEQTRGKRGSNRFVTFLYVLLADGMHSEVPLPNGATVEVLS